MPLTNIRRRISAIIDSKFDLQKETIDIINKNGNYINDLLRLQLQEGKDSNNENIKVFGREFYSDATVFDKEHGNYHPLGKQTEWITLFKTGAFYLSLVTFAEGRVFKTESTVSYFEDILAMSGEKVMKLNKQHLLEFTQEVLVPELKERYKLLNGL